MQVAQYVLFTKLAALVARNLAEPSIKVVASLMLMLANPNGAYMALPMSAKKAFFANTKESFKRRVRSMTLPLEYFAVLPDPVEMRANHAGAWGTVFADGEEPQPVDVNLGDLMALDSPYACRGGDFGLFASHASNAAFGAGRGGAAGAARIHGRWHVFAPPANDIDATTQHVAPRDPATIREGGCGVCQGWLRRHNQPFAFWATLVQTKVVRRRRCLTGREGMMHALAPRFKT